MTTQWPVSLYRTIQCPDCEDGTRWESRYGGNDPDTWPVRCVTCDGTGEIDEVIDEADDHHPQTRAPVSL